MRTYKDHIMYSKSRWGAYHRDKQTLSLKERIVVISILILDDINFHLDYEWINKLREWIYNLLDEKEVNRKQQEFLNKQRHG